MARRHLGIKMHETSKRKPGEKSIPEHNGRDHPEKEVLAKTVKWTSDVKSRRRTTEKCPCVLAIKWSLKNLLKSGFNQVKKKAGLI